VHLFICFLSSFIYIIGNKKDCDRSLVSSFAWEKRAMQRKLPGCLPRPRPRLDPLLPTRQQLGLDICLAGLSVTELGQETHLVTFTVCRKRGYNLKCHRQIFRASKSFRHLDYRIIRFYSQNRSNSIHDQQEFSERTNDADFIEI
jgi:hypothetical protein